MPPILDAAPLDPSSGGTTCPSPSGYSVEMLLRRDGSIDFRVLAGRVGFFVGTSTIAVAVGALIALAMS
jgi:hypothetical protein